MNIHNDGRKLFESHCATMISHRHYLNKRGTICGDGNSDIPFRPTKKRRIPTNARVQFSEEVIAHQEEKSNDKSNSSKSPRSRPISTWLTPNDFTKIKNSVFTTLEFIKLQGASFGLDTPLSSRYCSRGLEDYDTEQKCTKFSTVQRRTEAIQAVLKEQEFERQQLACQLQEGTPFCSRGLEDSHKGQNGQTAFINAQRRQFNFQRQQYMQRLQGGMPCNGMLDHSKISVVYMNHTCYNVEDAIEMGRKDSEDALAIYQSKPLPLAVNIAPTNIKE
jgi:hypothetical protein